MFIQFYFFFLGFFFLMPLAVEADGMGVDGAAAAAAASGAVSTAGVGCSWRGLGGSLRRFCILSMSERFKASNLLRKMEEWVLNFIHCSDGP
jgi:hypothetical protein